MANFTAKDVQALRQATGAGMMDAKRALEENDGDMEAATQWLREQGLAERGQAGGPRGLPGGGRRGPPGRGGGHRRAALRDRLRGQGGRVRVPGRRAGRPGGGQGRGRGGRAARTRWTGWPRRSRRTSRSAGSSGWRPEPARSLDTYLHQQAGRGVNAVVVCPGRWRRELAHDLAVHIAFARPTYLPPRGRPRGRGGRTSGPRSRRSAATRASRRRRCQRSSRVA